MKKKQRNRDGAKILRKKNEKEKRKEYGRENRRKFSCFVWFLGNESQKIGDESERGNELERGGT